MMEKMLPGNVNKGSGDKGKGGVSALDLFNKPNKFAGSSGSGSSGLNKSKGITAAKKK